MGCEICYVRFTTANSTTNPQTDGGFKNALLTLHSSRDLNIIFDKNNTSPQLLENFADGYFDIEHYFAIGVDELDESALIIPKGKFPIVIESNGNYNAHIYW